MATTIIHGDARDLSALPAAHFHAIATSPPYWGLRKYLAKDDPLAHLEIGAEETPDLYVESLRACAREWWRVLRDDGTLWINLGDTYQRWGAAPARRDHTGGRGHATRGEQGYSAASKAPARGASGLPKKSMLLLPFRVAMALQGDGWILRSAIPWVKRNAIPESVRDRPGTAHETIFLFAKSQRYYYDHEAVRVPVAKDTKARYGRAPFGGTKTEQLQAQGHRTRFDGRREVGETRAMRTSDWIFDALDDYHAHVVNTSESSGLRLSPDGEPLAAEVTTTPNHIAHFAVWPPKLVRPMLRLSCSARGCCPTCGAPWRRVVERARRAPTARGKRLAEAAVARMGKDHVAGGVERTGLGHSSPAPIVAQRWAKTCSCPEAEPVPSRVLDPFGGSGTTAAVGDELGLDVTLVELNRDYLSLAQSRVASRIHVESKQLSLWGTDGHEVDLGGG